MRPKWTCLGSLADISAYARGRFLVFSPASGLSGYAPYLAIQRRVASSVMRLRVRDRSDGSPVGTATVAHGKMLNPFTDQ